MDRSNDTRTEKSQGSDHGAASQSIIQDTDFRIAKRVIAVQCLPIGQAITASVADPWYPRLQ